MISSLVVETRPDATDAVAESLVELPGVEVHERSGANLVVTIEADELEDGYGAAASMSLIEGVIGVSLVYANFEE